MELFQAIKERRSIRKYKTTPVSEEQLNTILEAARWAPSWANTQCWSFVVVRDNETKERLGDTLSSVNPATAAIKSAPIAIVACAKLARSGHYKGTPVTDKGDWFMFDVALAMQNLTLAAHGLGLGTVNVGYLDAAKVAQILELPEGIAVVEMTPLGYPDEEPEAPPRKELSEFVFYEKYGQVKS
ncbi:MAG: nitroreductase family protein [Dehalococcoidia bacterium]|jgi:nitroreductase|nr:nitroreductase family protein [Chloroflexota bacterium]MCK4242876.1 nitroreductase family protein [Dehalococcoidia bacterium]